MLRRDVRSRLRWRDISHRERHRRADDRGISKRGGRHGRSGARVPGSHRTTGPDQRKDSAGSECQRTNGGHLLGKHYLHRHGDGKAVRRQSGSLCPGAQCPARLWRRRRATDDGPPHHRSDRGRHRSDLTRSERQLFCPGWTPNGRDSPAGGAGQPAGPAGTPSSGRTRGPAGGSGFGGFGAFGKVTAVSGAGFTVVSSRPQNGTATTAPTSETVQTPAGTKYTQTGAANAQALVVGVCVTALGKADDTGSIAATSIALRPAENGSCSSGFGGGFGGRGSGVGAAPTGGSAGA